MFALTYRTVDILGPKHSRKRILTSRKARMGKKLAFVSTNLSSLLDPADLLRDCNTRVIGLVDIGVLYRVESKGSSEFLLSLGRPSCECSPVLAIIIKVLNVHLRIYHFSTRLAEGILIFCALDMGFLRVGSTDISSMSMSHFMLVIVCHGHEALALVPWDMALQSCKTVLE